MERDAMGSATAGMYAPLTTSPTEDKQRELKRAANKFYNSEDESESEDGSDSEDGFRERMESKLLKGNESDTDPSITVTQDNTFLGRILNARWWDILVTSVICTNTLVMAVQADMPQWTQVWVITDNVFLFFFTVELSLRLIFYRCAFFKPGPDQSWNLFDFVIVVIGILDQWVKPLIYHENENDGAVKVGSMLLILRTFRILRVLRAIRIFKAFKELYQLSMGLFNSFPSVVWVAMLFTLLLLVSSIFITNIVGHHAENFEDPEAIKEWFGTVLRTMDTLFVFLTCDDWSTPARMVNQVIPAMEIFWIAYMFLGAFTLLSLLTGLMADKMNEQRDIEEDHANEVSNKELIKRLYDVKKAFEKTEHEGHLTVDEFKKLVSNPKIQKYLDEIDTRIDEEDAGSIFEAMDEQGQGYLNWEGLASGLIRLSAKNCRVKDICWLEGTFNQSVRLLNEADGDSKSKDSYHVSEKQRQYEKVDDLYTRAETLRDTVANMKTGLEEFCEKHGYKTATVE